jgi:hypothetical protein
VRAESPSELANALDRLVAAFGDDIGGAELAPERDTLRVVAEQDDLLGRSRRPRPPTRSSSRSASVRMPRASATTRARRFRLTSRR